MTHGQPILLIVSQVGEILKEKFDSAHEVQQRKRRGRRMLLPRFQRFKPHTDTDLVYLRDSPDYCEYDLDKGSLGTHGRECNPVRVISKMILSHFDYVFLKFLALPSVSIHKLYYFTALPRRALTVILKCILHVSNNADWQWQS